MNTAYLLQLLQITSNEEHSYLDQHHKRTQFFIVLLSTLIGATIAATANNSFEQNSAFLLLVPPLLFLVAEFGKRGSRRIYQRIIETIAMRAKIEQSLGLTNQTAFDQDGENIYWIGEAICMPRHISDRRQYESSQQFVDEAMKGGYQIVVERVFLAFQIFSGIMFLGLSWVAFAPQ